MPKTDNASPAMKMGTSRFVVDDSRMDTLYPDIFNVTNSREEVTLSFGTVRSCNTEENQLSALLSSRIILSPYTAKRIAILLANKISEFEAIHGKLSAEAPPQFNHGQTSILYVESPDSNDTDGSEKAIRLMRLIDGLNTDYAYERSYKLARKSILQNRFLFGINKNSIKNDPEHTIISLCQQMDMPLHFLSQCREMLNLAKCVHFGFEENKNGCMYKVYLEFDIDLKFGPIGTQVMTDPFLLHLGFKWSSDDNTNCALSRYTCYPFLSHGSIIERIGKIYCEDHHEKALQFTTKIMNAAVSRMPEHKFLYIEVVEDNNPRTSFDIKLYEANLLMREITPLMDDILSFYEIPSDQFTAINNRVRDKTFGHLSGGIDRAGQDFLTLYYGVQWR